MRIAPRTPNAGVISVARTIGVGDGVADAVAVGVGRVLVTLKTVGRTVENEMF